MTSLRVSVAQIGSRRSYLVPAALADAGVLETFFTDIYIKSAAMRAFLARTGARGAAARHSPGIPPHLVRDFALTSLPRQMMSRLATGRAADVDRWLNEAKSFCSAVSGFIPGKANLMYAYSSAALEIFQRASEEGCACCNDQATAPITVERKLVSEAAERWPEWFEPVLPHAREDEYSLRQAEEWRLSDCILCNSSFTARLVQEAGGPSDKCAVVPLGLAASRLPDSSDSDRSPVRGGKRLRIAFAGDDAARKGLPDLVEACRVANIPKENVVVSGCLELKPDGRRLLESATLWKGRLPHSDLMDEFQRADVFVMPTVSDTFGLVVLEAMSRGCIPIVTPNAGVADLIRDGVNGFMVPMHRPDMIAERLQELEADQSLLAEMRNETERTASEHTLENYRARFVAALANIQTMRKT